MLELAAGGCAVEVQLNGVPLAALGPAGGSVSLAVHEYTLAGRNELTLVVGPAAPGAAAPEPAARRDRSDVGAGADGACPPGPVAGRSRLPASSASAEWATTEGRSYDAPSAHKREVDLPINFPRWRWLDAPPVELGAAGQPGPPRVPAAARGRAGPRQPRAADRRREAALRRAGGRVSERCRGRGATLPRPRAGVVCCESIEGAATGGRRARVAAAGGWTPDRMPDADRGPGAANQQRAIRSSAIRRGRSGWRWSKEESMSCVERGRRGLRREARRGAMAS